MRLEHRLDIPPCNASRSGEVYYVSRDEQFYYCDGRKLVELDLEGEPGRDGVSWLFSLGDAGAADCASGGVLIEVGPDRNRDGVLGASEVAAAQAVCDGASGPKGEPGPVGPAGDDGVDAPVTLVATSAATSGECAAGGVAIHTGVDADGDGELDAEEVEHTELVCNGSNGQSTLIAQSPEPAGDHCEQGGTRIDAGLDANGDGELEAEEVDTTSYVCQSGVAGSCGDGLVTPPELCDSAIASGSGACPASCDDADSCTADSLVDAGGCQASCRHEVTSESLSGDGCCPAGGTPLTDDDCEACKGTLHVENVMPDVEQFCSVTGTWYTQEAVAYVNVAYGGWSYLPDGGWLEHEAEPGLPIPLASQCCMLDPCGGTLICPTPFGNYPCYCADASQGSVTLDSCGEAFTPVCN